MPLQPVPRTLLRDSAYAAIRDAVVRGDLAPGVAVRDQDLAEQLGLSRAPVRDALARLADEGLVERKPQSHTRVTPLVPHEVRDAAAVVRAMHELAARTGVPALTDAQVATMRAANRRFAAACATGDLDAALAADDDLHQVLVDAAGNRAAAATIARYTPLIRRLERHQFSPAGATRSVALHEQLIDACADRDATRATEITALIWQSLVTLAADPTLT
ncbi:MULTISPECIES: GntR family transcriptional regulator [unclassified Solwaraspora]|uniref:GntR family transcriptional regulator n=1 Tax=unclassified Solwaraspora TaxID=2627926 RepID=UPI00259B1505|nr:GntR family transcriptional regulator [Solwaraspora sp. WMMA2056]WJK42977.1 GntR family transcriptional regulator [Solwaraspora sp. WMMA2056]